MTSRRTIPVKFYAEKSKREPVRDWIMELNKKERKMIGSDIKAVQLRWPIGLPLVRPFGEGLWEIRSKLENRTARIVFCFAEGCLVLLHAFIKKTQKTPKKDLTLTKKRYKNLGEIL
jgi:phage-related protein